MMKKKKRTIDMMDHYKQLLEETLDEVMMENLVSDGEDEMDGVIMADPVMIYREENPYQVVEANTETHYYQVIGNEIITITKGHGVCCLCGVITDILYTDNTYNNNIPVQICKPCITSIMEN